jgi:DNA-directed RNA polymerase subunit F
MGFKLSAERDAGLVKLMESPYLSSQEADALLRNIKSSAQRSTALQTYIERVARYDPGAARRYLDRQVTFSDEKQKLMEIIENAENGVF